MEMDEKSKWTEAEIRTIVRDELKKCQERSESDTDDSSSFFYSIKKKFNESERKNKKIIEELECQCDEYSKKIDNFKHKCLILMEENDRLKAENDNCHKYIEELKHECGMLRKENDKLEAVNNECEKRAKNLEIELSSYKRCFVEVYVLYNEVCSLSEKDRAVFQRFICTDDAVRFMYAVTNEKAMNSLYDYMMYELKNMSETVFGIYNRLLAFMCSINKDYELIGCKGKIDDRYHIDIEKKHSGDIKRVVIGGYKYAVSGDAVKKALVEV